MVSSLIGFLVGYRFARWKFSSNDYESHTSSSTQNDLCAIKCSTPLVEPNLNYVKTLNNEKILLAAKKLHFTKDYKAKIVYL